MNNNAADQIWERLVRESGPLAYPRQLDDDAFSQAMREQRVLLIELERDGYGGGLVYITLIVDGRPIDLAARRRQHNHLYSWKVVMFARPLRLTDAERAGLAGGLSWESWADIPYLPGD